MKIVDTKVIPFLYVTTDTGLFRIKLVEKFYIECLKHSEWDLVIIGIDLSKEEYNQLSDYAQNYM